MSKRSYQQNCALARASDLIGERWTVLLLRDLLISPRRFKDLSASLKGMGTNLLATRLQNLEVENLIERQQQDDGARCYALTERGRTLEPALLALIRWGLNHGPENRVGDHHRDDWDLLALKALFQSRRASGLTLSVQFDAPDLTGWVRIADRQMQVGLGVLNRMDIRINGTIADLFINTPAPAGLLTHGSAEELQAFMAAFALRI